MYTVVAVQLRRYVVILEGLPENYNMHPDDLDLMVLPYEYGNITAYIDPGLALEDVYREINAKARELHLGRRLAADAVFA